MNKYWYNGLALSNVLGAHATGHLTYWWNGLPEEELTPPVVAVVIGEALEIDSAEPVTAHTGVQFIILETDIIALAPLTMPSTIIPTPQAVELVSALNWTPLTDIAGSVTGATREALAGAGKTIRVTSSLITNRQLPVKVYRLPSLYRFDSAAYSRALSILQWLEGALKGYSVTINVFRNQIEIGHVGRIAYYPRFGLANGFTGIVCGWREVPAKGQVTVVLIGKTPNP